MKCEPLNREFQLSEGQALRLAPEWDSIELTALSEVGFSRTHLIQIAKQGKLSAAEVQDSIHFFAFDLKYNAKGREIKGPALNFFVGILRKGLPYAPPENYESPEAEARRKYLEGKRRLAERKAAEEKELVELEFAEWKRGLATDKLAEILPEHARRPGPMQESALRTHFESEILLARSKNVPGYADAERAQVRKQIEESLNGN